MKAKIKWISLAAIVLILVIAAMLIPYDPPKLTMPEIRHRVDILNESAAVTTPHMSLGKDIRKANMSLFEKVERGALLSRSESAAYRVLYQSILKDNQSRLSLFDEDLTVINDVEMLATNNVGGRGIHALMTITTHLQIGIFPGFNVA